MYANDSVEAKDVVKAKYNVEAKDGVAAMVTSEPITNFGKVLRRIGVTAQDRKRVRAMLFGTFEGTRSRCARTAMPRKMTDKPVRAKGSGKKRVRSKA